MANYAGQVVSLATLQYNRIQPKTVVKRYEERNAPLSYLL